MIEPQDDFPHPVPPQAFMTWQESWVFPAVDRDNRASALFHFSLRPDLGEGVFTAKFHVRGETYRHVSHSPVPKDLTTLRPVADDHVSFVVEEPGQRFRLRHGSPMIEADLVCTARWPAWDFAGGPATADSTPGDVGNVVLPFHCYEQALDVRGSVRVLEGEFAGEAMQFTGWGNRDHSWGWRDDFRFRRHHWLCASFTDRFIGGSVLLETSQAEQTVGGCVSTDAGNDGVVAVDTSEASWLEPGTPLEIPDHDVTYGLETMAGNTHVVTAHLGDRYGRLILDGRSEDRREVYEGVQVFCDFTHHGSGERGAGVLEIGKYNHGEEVGDRSGSHRPDRARKVLP